MENKAAYFVKRLCVFLLIAALCASAFVLWGKGEPDSQPESASGVTGSAAVQSGSLSLSYNEKTLDFTVTNVETGTVWNSGDSISEAKNLNDTWKAFAMSGVTVGYYDQNGKLNQISLADETVQSIVNVTEQNGGFTAKITFTTVGIGFTLSVSLDGDRVDIKIPFDSVKETKSPRFNLRHIILYPFLGASENQSDDKMLIPDGSGALIDLSQKTAATVAFTGRYYGDDIGVEGLSGLKKYGSSAQPELLSMPVYGIIKGQTDAYLAYIKSGAEYARLDASASSIVTDYNFIHATFIYRDAYYQAVNKKGDGFTTFQRDINHFDIHLSFMFVGGSGTGYGSLAKRYREELINENLLPDSLVSDTPLMRLEFFMADNRKSAFGAQLLPMSDAPFCEGVLSGLALDGLTSLTASVTAFQKGGMTNASPSDFEFEPRTGSDGEYKKLIDTAKSQNIPLYFTVNPVTVYPGSGGYKKTDVAQNISEQLITVGGADFSKYNILSPPGTANALNSFIKGAKKQGVYGYSLPDVGKALYSNHVRNESTRTQTLESHKELLSSVREPVELRDPNQYLWQYAASLTDMPMSSSGYIITHESIPFMQMVLKGRVPMYAPAINLNDRGAENILRLLDYASGANYIITKNDPSVLYDCDSRYIFTSQYDLWKEDIRHMYSELSDVWAKLDGAEYTDRKAIATQVYQCSYSNGTVVYINYSSVEYSQDGITVPAQGYLVK